MRQFALLVSAVFLLALCTPAQTDPQASLVPGVAIESTAGEASSSPGAASLAALPEWLTSSSSAAPYRAAASSSSDDSGPAADPAQVVIGIRETYPFQLYLGYTFIRFYEVPGTAVNTNGFNYSIVFYPKDWIGADGEFVLTLGDQYPYQARFLLGMGGARVRWRPFQKNIELWAHGLVGATHFTPQTAYGKQGAFAYEVGGGADINTANGRYAIRAGADMVGTRYFNTNQFSPKISIGFVYKF
jgi:hypothetical protein